MEITQSFVVQRPRAQVWALFADVDRVAPCIPGFSLTAPSDGRHVAARVEVKLGPIAAAFAGDAEHSRDDSSFSGVIAGTGRDRTSGSRARGEARYSLLAVADDAATDVSVTIAFSLAGPLAQFGRAGIVNDLARRLTGDFATNLHALLEAEPGAAAPAAPPELDAGKLVAASLWARIKAALARLFAKG
ncbi:MAG: SRPBCC family protein [Alphaproteobacteria bacterium]|jgi:carbon-monoxide dehydrogenase small subunit|nr:SRPBCC family protein [Alphaproteobacteria bacterium]